MEPGKRFNFIARWLIFEEPNSVDAALAVQELT
jgi:hypothetical protein